MGRRTLLLCLTLHLLLIPAECRTPSRWHGERADRISRERRVWTEGPERNEVGWIRMRVDDGAGGDEGVGGEAGEDDRDEKGNHEKELTAHLEEVVASLSTNLTQVWALLTSLEGRVDSHHPPPTTTTTTTTTPPPPIKTVPSLCWNPSSWCQAYEGGPLCSGRGECVCGECACFADRQGGSAYGRFCECHDGGCNRYQGQVCGGPDRGECQCGRCNCRSGYIGPACDCPTTTKPCYNPANGRLCSGNGNCECGACKCYLSMTRYVGPYCEESVEMSTGWCQPLLDCIICHHVGPDLRNITQYSGNCSSVTCEPHLTITDSKSEGMKECRYLLPGLGGDCLIVFHFLQRHLEVDFYIDRNESNSCFRLE